MRDFNARAHIDLAGINGSIKLIFWILLSSCYGKPSSEYLIQDFVDNFYQTIISKNFRDNYLSGMESKLNDCFDTYDICDNTGGYQFYEDLANSGCSTKEEITEFIQSYTISDKPKSIKIDTISVEDTSTKDNLENIECIKENPKSNLLCNIGNKNYADINKINKKLTAKGHFARVDVLYYGRGGCNIIAQYDPIKGHWEILAGKICSSKGRSSDNQTMKAEKIVEDGIKSGWINSDFTINNKSDRPTYFSTLGRLATFCLRNSTQWECCYMHEIDGSYVVTAREALEDEGLIYNRFIEANQEKWKEEEINR